MTERILITGVTGFVGSHLADYIVSLPGEREIYATRRWHHSRLDNVRQLEDAVTFIDCDLVEAASVNALIDETAPDRIFHCAAESFVSPSWQHPSTYMAVNYFSTVNLLEALRTTKSSAIIHIPGSGEEYGDIDEDELPINEQTVLRPVNPYAVTKIAQDLIAYVYYRSFGVKCIRTRAFNHEGPRREKVFGIPWYAYQIAMIEAGKMAPVMKVGHVDDRRNFTHVRDMVEAYWLSMEKCEPGELYLVGADEEAQIHTFRQALEGLIEMSSHDDISYEIDPQYVRPTNVPRLIGDTRKFRDITGWAPTISFEQILVDTLEYWRARVADGTA